MSDSLCECQVHFREIVLFVGLKQRQVNNIEGCIVFQCICQQPSPQHDRMRCAREGALHRNSLQRAVVLDDSCQEPPSFIRHIFVATIDMQTSQCRSLPQCSSQRRSQKFLVELSQTQAQLISLTRGAQSQYP